MHPEWILPLLPPVSLRSRCGSQWHRMESVDRHWCLRYRRGCPHLQSVGGIEFHRGMSQCLLLLCVLRCERSSVGGQHCLPVQGFQSSLLPFTGLRTRHRHRLPVRMDDPRTLRRNPCPHVVSYTKSHARSDWKADSPECGGVSRSAICAAQYVCGWDTGEEQ